MNLLWDKRTPATVPPHIRWLRRMSVGLIAVSLALFVYPFWGLLAYSVRHITLTPPSDAPKPAAQVKQPSATPTLSPPLLPATANNDQRPKTNTLVIPKIGVKMNIVGGIDGKTALRNGAWLLPGTATPEDGGNTVIGGHRYLFRPPSAKTFYHLDKLAAGDLVNVAWQGTVYTYRVRETKVVEPWQVEILAPSDENLLTLFTCTPIFTSKQRLVVVAERLVEK